jgi:phosphatidylinositol alpha-1,6-mannosyltransferase
VFEPVSWAKRRALGRAALLLSSSRHTAERAAQLNPGISLARAVHLCVEPPLFGDEADADPAPLEAYRPASRRRAVLIVGNMYRNSRYKGHRQLIEAWGEVVAACGEAELWIVGGGDGQPELEAQTRALAPAVARQIHFLGQLEDEALQRRYQTCRAFAMPSTGEGFGLVFVEAARYGVPCIGCRRDAAREIIEDGETGLLVEQSPGEIAAACLRLLTDDALALRLGESGRRRYREQFRYENFRDRLLHALRLNGDMSAPRGALPRSS